jgi:hypothetical protein
VDVGFGVVDRTWGGGVGVEVAMELFMLNVVGYGFLWRGLGGHGFLLSRGYAFCWCVSC